MIVGFLGTSYAQNAAIEKPTLTADQQQAVDELISMDPKLSAEEIEQLKIAVLGAPAHAEPVIDQKEESQPEFVQAPWKPEPAEEREEVLPKEVIQTSAQVGQTGTQPQPEKAENTLNYHSMKGPATQAQPAKSDNIINYHSMKGTNTQPSPGPSGK